MKDKLFLLIVLILSSFDQIWASSIVYTVLATKTRLLTLKSNISPLMESKTKLNIPIFFLVKSSYIFW